MSICTCPNCGHNWETNPKQENGNWIGQVYEKWTIVEDLGYTGSNKYFLCKCECGNLKRVALSSLTQGKSKSCGCTKERRNKIAIGEKFGSWTVIAVKDDFSLCRCECGNQREVLNTNLIYHKSNSCGCKSNEEKRRNGKTVKPDFSQLLTIYKSVVSHWACEEIAKTNPEYAKWLDNFDNEMVAEGRGAWVGRPNAEAPPASPE